MAAKVRLIGTYTPQSEGLAVSYTSLTVSGVTTGSMEILMSVGGLRIQVSSKCVEVFPDGDIQKVGLLEGVFPCEFNSAVEGIDMVKEGIQAATVPSPNEKHVIYVSPPNPGTARSLTEHAFLKVTHEEASKGRRHARAHGGAMHLEIVLSKKGEIVLGQH